MPKLKRLWTDEDDVRLRYLLEGGDTFMLMAAKLDRTTTAVKSRSSKLGLGRRPTQFRGD
jgi:hypothetical protein